MPNIIGLGLDATDIDRIADVIDRYGHRFLQRIFTDGEIAYCTERREPAIRRAFCGATSRSSGAEDRRNCSCTAAPADGCRRLAAAQRC